MRAFPRGSFIACAGSFGNCVRATEGGIPKSSRVQVVAYVPRVHAGVSEVAMRLKRGPRGQGNQPQGVSPSGSGTFPDRATWRFSMKTIKSLVLGSAAGLLAVGGAQAADLPVKAKAVEYVKVCSLYGPGFFYIPGTDTCMKIGGALRVDTTFNGAVYDAPPVYNGGNTAYQNRTSDYYNDRARMQLTVDTRTATEYG